MKRIGLTLILKAQGTDLRQREMPQVMQCAFCLETSFVSRLASLDLWYLACNALLDGSEDIEYHRMVCKYAHRLDGSFGRS